VYKLVELDGEPRIKISQDVVKVTIPGRKKAYRLSGEQGHYLADVMLLEDEPPPEVGRPYLCRHPFIPEHRVHIIPTRVDELHSNVFHNGKCRIPDESLDTIRERSMQLRRGIRAITGAP